MALTELKSDLSKFRRPIQKPIVETQSTKINYDNDKTPLSGLLTELSSPSKIEKTAEKVGVTPKPLSTTPDKPVITPKYEKIEKFVGETTPNNFDFSPQFTTPQLSSVDFFPNTSADGFTTKMRETRFNLSGLTSPKPLTLEARFLGETDPNRMSLEGRFLGETTPNPLGATPDKPATTPNPLGATPNKPATTPQIFNFTPQFTTPIISITDYFPNTDAKGFTPKIRNTQFVDINNGIFTQRIPNSKLGEVNFFPNDDVIGFTKNFVDKNDTKFTGISNDTFTSPKVNFNGDYGLGFSPGNKIKLEGSALANYQNGNQKWVYGKKYEEGYVSIGDLLLRENSPSYIDKIYSQYNLQDDSFNPFPPIFHQPFVLRGIQRKREKEPQKWGFGVPESLVTGGIDLIRGGVVSSTERALIDVYRIGRFILSPKGLVWSALQFGMQRTNTYNKIWTPINLLATVGGQHIGFKPQRHGILPFDKLDAGSYERLIPRKEGDDNDKYKTKLEDFRKNERIFTKLASGDSSIRLDTQNGGPESVYGVGISTTNTSTNTFSNPGQDYGNTEANYNQKFNPIFKTTELPLPNIGGLTSVPLKTPRNPNEDFENTYEKSIPTTDDEKLKFGIANKQYDEGKTPETGYEKIFENNNYASRRLKTGDSVLNYDDIRNLANETKLSFNDFRNKTKESVGFNSQTGKGRYVEGGLRYNLENYYTNENIEKKLGLGNSDECIGRSTNGDNYQDLIKLSFTTSDKTIQFRGTVNSISETFSPNWTEIKYSGRAENAYIYDTFSRELTFGFRVFAYSVQELGPMWIRLERLANMSMPTYVKNGYRGNITNFTLGTMYIKFPALITNLTYTVPDDFTWEIGLNRGSDGNELPMGVDISITLKLLGHTLHSNTNTPYDFYYNPYGRNNANYKEDPLKQTDDFTKVDPKKPNFINGGGVGAPDTLSKLYPNEIPMKTSARKSGAPQILPPELSPATSLAPTGIIGSPTNQVPTVPFPSTGPVITNRPIVALP